MHTAASKNFQQKSKAGTRSAKSSGNSFDKWYPLVGIVIVTAIVFSNSIIKSFASIDDDVYIINNPFIKSLSWQSIKDIWTSFYACNYHPITTLSFAIEYRLFGLNPVPWHIINLLIHLANVSLVYILLDKLSGRREIVIIGALFFGIHPLHVESVVWITERKDLFYSFFFLFGLITYVQYIKEGSRKKLFITLFLFLLSLLSKSAAVTFPLLIVLFDYYYRRGRNRKVLMEKIPFFLLSVVFGIITILSQRAGGALADVARPEYSAIQNFFAVNYAVLFYPFKLVLPFNLCALHFTPPTIPWHFYLCPFVVAGIVWMVIRLKMLKREVVFGLLFYLFSIILVLQILPVGYSLVADRYSYIPFIGFFFIAGHLYIYIKEGKTPLLNFLRPSLNYLVVTVAIFFAVLTYQRNKVWYSYISLSEDVANKYPFVSYSHMSLALDYKSAGRTDEALASFNRAIELKPDLAEAYYNRGNIYYELKKYDLAEKDILKAIKLIPEYREAMHGLGMIYTAQARYEEAVNYFNKAIAIEPEGQYYRDRAVANFYLKKFSQVIEDCSLALERNPSNAEVFYIRAESHYRLNDKEKACEDWKDSAFLGYEAASKELAANCR